MFNQLPTTYQEFLTWDWPRLEPYFTDLEQRPLTAGNIRDWLADWSRIATLVDEAETRLTVATTQNTEDEVIQADYEAYLENILQPFRAAQQKLREKLIDSDLAPDDVAVPLRKLKANAGIFRDTNQPLLIEDEKLRQDVARLFGAQTVEWDGEVRTPAQLRPMLLSPDRATREQAWRKISERSLQDREAMNEIWVKLMDLRGRIAANAGLPSYLDYRWRELGRFDYTPDDCYRFHDAIEAVVVPAATRIHERHRRALKLDRLRPWDSDVDPQGGSPLKPFEDVGTLVEGTASIFQAIDPQLGGHFDDMIRRDLLDLDNRKGKGPGGYCTEFALERQPFIFMNAVGLHDDVQTLLHEGGHAFHVYESRGLPYLFQRIENTPIEFIEVASMSMEFIGGHYLAKPTGFYSQAEAARAQTEHLEAAILFWPYMAVVDAFQLWAYQHPAQGSDPAACDAKWIELWRRFMPDEDWTGLEDAMMTGWHRKHHIFRYPLYYVEYGLAQLGAVQVWRNSLKDEAGAVAAYRRALSLGGTRPLPELFQTAGAKFQPDTETLRECVDLIEETLESLRA